MIAPRGERVSDTPLPVSTRPPGNRKRLLTWGGIAAGVVAVGGVLAALLSSPGAPEPSEVRVDPSLALQVGESAQVRASVLAADGSALPDVALRWTSGSPEVATVDDRGVVQGVSAGTASVRAAAGTLEGATLVTVAAAAVVGPPTLAQRSVAFSATAGGGSPRAQTVDVGGTAPEGASLLAQVDYPDGAPDGWLSAGLEGATPPTRLRVQAERPPSAPGTYRASVVVGWGPGQPADTVRVSLAVAGAGPPPTRRFTVAGADSLAWRQLFLLDDDQSASARAAVKDTTDILWRDAALPDSVRARAAYAHAQAAVLLGERDEGLRWAQRAADAAPADSLYRQYLQGLRGGGAP